MNLSDSEAERLENGYPPSCDYLITTSYDHNNERYDWESRSDASDGENSVDAHAQSSDAFSSHSVPFGLSSTDAENSIDAYAQASQASSPRSFGSPFSDDSLIAHIDAVLSEDEASQALLFYPLSRQVSPFSDGSSGYEADSDSSSIISYISSSYSPESTPGVSIDNVTDSRPRSPLVHVAPIKIHYTRNFVKNANLLWFNPQGKVHNTRSRTRVEQIKFEELRSSFRF